MLSYESDLLFQTKKKKRKKKEKVSVEELAYSFDLKGWITSHSATLNQSTLIPFFKQKPSTGVQLE